MRVAVVTTVHPPLDGRITYKEATALVAAGHDVTLVARRGAGPGDDATAELREMGIDFVPLSVPSSKSGRVRLWREAFGALRRGGFDVWHVHDPELLPLTLSWRPFVRPSPAIVYDVHEDLAVDVYDKTWIPRVLRPVISRIWRTIDRFGSARVELVVACTRRIAERFTSSADAVALVRNYPLADASSAVPDAGRGATSPGPVHVIYVGGLSVARGAVVMAEAVESLDGAARLDLFGHYHDDATRAAVESAAGEHVTYHGQVPFVDVPQLIEGADIGLVVLEPTRKFTHSLPVKIFEYYRGGCAVVASDFEDWAELVPPTVGRRVDPTDVEAVAGAIRELASDPERLSRMQSDARVLVAQEFSWAGEAAELVDAYDRLSR